MMLALGHTPSFIYLYSIRTYCSQVAAVPGATGGGVLTIFHPGWVPVVIGNDD